MIRVIAFDLDGTLGDTIPMCLHAFSKILSPYAGKILTDEEIIRWFGLNEEGLFKNALQGKDWQKAFDDFHRYYEEIHDQWAKPFVGVPELLQELKQYFPVALITGKGAPSCKITLKKFGFENTFDLIKTGSAEFASKIPPLQQTLEHFAIKPNEMIYIGDAITDATACQELGIPCISAAWSSVVNAQELEKINPGNVIYSIPGLRQKLFEFIK